MKRVFIVHGWRSSPESNWFRWLEKELNSRGFEAHVLAMPRAAMPHPSEWIDCIHDAVGKADAETYFIGHSLGCIAIARFLEAHIPEEVIGGCVFVAGFSGNIHNPSTKEFYELTFHPDIVRKWIGKAVAIFSDNDPMVPLELAKNFSEQIGAKAILEKNMFHFRGSDGCTELPVVLERFLEIAKS